jgi:MFS family permease
MEIPKPVWQLQIGAVLNAFGTGSTVPFLMLYLSRGRGFDIVTSGILVGMVAFTGMLVIPFVGSVIDRWGPKRVLMLALALLTVAFLGYIAVRHPWQAAVCGAVAGMGNACLWPSNALLMTSMLGPEKRHMAFAVERTAANLGLGLGVFLGGIMIATIGYTSLFLLDAASFVLYLALVLRLAPAGDPPSSATADGTAEKTSMPALLRIGPLRRMLVLKFVMVLAGFGPFEVLALFARDRADVSPGLIGAVFLVNTLVIVTCQLPLTNALPGKRRMHVLLGVAVLWAAAWAIVAVIDTTLTGAAAAALLTLVVAVFGLGEAAQVPALDPVFLEVSPERAQGRTMAMSAMAFQGALALGAAGGGWLLGHAPRILWPSVAVLALLTGLLALAWERTLPTDSHRTKAAA